MARIRTIKPEFWTDEVVVELDYLDRLLFIGLWNFADDQGYLAMRPKRIKMQVFPGDDCDVLAALERLWKVSLVTLYACPDGLLLHITNWSRHQKISNPAREKYSQSDLRKLDSWETSPQSPLEPYPAEGKGREGKGRESTSSAAAETDTDSSFAVWWSHYPRKVAKGAAAKAYKSALKKTDAETLAAGLRRALPGWQGKEPDFIPHAATWLNAERWADEAPATLSVVPPQNSWMRRELNPGRYSGGAS